MRPSNSAEDVNEFIPLSYLHIWCKKNEQNMSFSMINGDRYQVTEKGIFVQLANGLSQINPRNVFRTINRYPSLGAEQMTPRITIGANQYYFGVFNPASKVAPKPMSINAVRDDVEGYLSRLNELSPLQFYVAVRAYEQGLCSLAHLGRIANNLKPGETMGMNIIRENLCSWENLLAICLDVHRNGGQNATLQSELADFDLCGEILVGLGKISRSDLERALMIKREGRRPLGEILVEMGVCEPPDVQSCLDAQSQMRDGVAPNAGLLGDLLLENGVVRENDLYEALRLQKVSRKPLHEILLSMDVCKPAQLHEFARKHPEAVRGRDLDEQILTSYLLREKVIEPRQLQEALRLQNQGRRMLGELLVTLKLCEPDDIERVLSAQGELRNPSKPLPSKLGELLTSKGIDIDAIEAAARQQEIGRQKLGVTLVGLGACTEQDFDAALQLQFDWRETTKSFHDQLGQELLRAGSLTENDLSAALDVHARVGKPLGHVLVEHGWCTPEVVIDTLLQRDERRRNSFFEYINEHPSKQATQTKQAPPAPAKLSLVNKISALFNRQQDK